MDFDLFVSSRLDNQFWCYSLLWCPSTNCKRVGSSFLCWMPWDAFPKGLHCLRPSFRRSFASISLTIAFSPNTFVSMSSHGSANEILKHAYQPIFHIEAAIDVSFAYDYYALPGTPEMLSQSEWVLWPSNVRSSIPIRSFKARNERCNNSICFHFYFNFISCIGHKLFVCIAPISLTIVYYRC